MAEEELNSPTAHDQGHFTEEYLNYIKKITHDNARKEVEEAYRAAEARSQARPRYKNMTYKYSKGDRITVYDDERLEFGYIVRIKTLSVSDRIVLVVIVIRLTDRRVVFAILPKSDEGEKLPWLRYFTYEATQNYLQDRRELTLESPLFGSCESLDYHTTEQIRLP